MDLSRTNQIRQAILYCAADSAHVAEESEQNEPWPTVKFLQLHENVGGVSHSVDSAVHLFLADPWDISALGLTSTNERWPLEA